MIQTLLISGALLAVGMALLLVKVLGRKNGTFSSQHIHDSEAMRERGIHCVMDQDREMRSQKRLNKGPNIMQGYYNRPQETAAVIDKDGFLHTGDLGRIDEKGRIYITGRSKEIIVLSNGKNVQPNEIEYKLEKYDQRVKEAAVVQDGDMLRAIIVPQTEWAHNLTDAEVEEA